MKYYLHYVSGGKNGIYGREVFIKEAKQIGVNRSLPYFLIKKLKWGDKILLGTFEARHVGENAHKELDNEQVELSVNRKFQDGIAHIFGYFVVSGLNLIASIELKEKLYSQLDITTSNNTPLAVKRSCGSYTIASSHVVTNSLTDIIEKAQTLAKEMNEKIKYFVGGNFYELNTKCSKCEDNLIPGEFHTLYNYHECPKCKGTGKQTIQIEGVNFSRSLIELEFDSIEKIEEIPQQVGFIKDYDKKSYVAIKERT